MTEATSEVAAADPLQPLDIINIEVVTNQAASSLFTEPLKEKEQSIFKGRGALPFPFFCPVVEFVAASGSLLSTTDSDCLVFVRLCSGRY